jgi:cell division initiation protein
MRKKKQETQEAGFTTPATRPRLTPIDVQQREFRLAFRGYNERDVDEFLDLVTEELAAFTEENRRLQDHGGDPDLVPLAAADASWASREAEGMLERARADAAEIVSEAESRAAAILAAAGAGSGDQRGVIAPYLNREREFLQSLGQLVQQHAESVRRMVKTTKQQAAAVPSASPSPSPDAAAGSRPAGHEREDGSQVIRIEPAETAEQVAAAPAESLAEGAPSEPGPGRHRSVRELFWGEE